MNKTNNKKAKQANTLYNYFKKNDIQDKNLIQVVHNIQRKKKTHQISIDAQEKSSSLPVFVKKNHIFSFAKEVSMQQLLSKCPVLMKISQQIQDVVSLPKLSVRNILKKYIQSNSNSLWCDKYKPTDSSQLFNISVSEKIKDWFQAFFQHKNKLYQSSDRYLNDFQQQKSYQILKKIKRNRWKLQALVVRGRTGIGKSSAIKAIAEQLQIEWQQCGNHFNPTKYLRQKNESTQSQSVKTAMSRKLKLQKNSQMITKFMSSEDKPQRQKSNQSLKCQIIHHVGCIYPESEASKFYSQLNKCIQLSKIPFVMTDIGERLPYQCKDYDQVQYEVGQTEIIDEFLWIIYHFERIFSIDTTKFILKQQIFDQINRQIQQISFVQLIQIQKISHLCCLNSYQLDKILNFMEFHDLENIAIEPLIVEKYLSLSKHNLLQYIQYLHLIDTIESDQSTNLSETIQKDTYSTKDQQYSQTRKIIQFQQLKRNIFNTIHKTSLNAEKDNQSQLLDLQKFIQIDIHKDIKRNLSKKINKEINIYYDRNRSTLKESQIQFFPMLVRKGSISKKTNVIQDFKKIFNQKQCLYAQKYCKFIEKS